MQVTIFEKILSGEIKADIVYQDDNVVAFRDIMPQAKIHLLFIHRKKTINAVELGLQYPQHAADIFSAIAKYSKEFGLDRDGLRIVTNTGPHAGQTVFYTHFHVLAGEALRSFGA
jgi:histidine triad (HIT) family protein